VWIAAVFGGRKENRTRRLDAFTRDLTHARGRQIPPAHWTLAYWAYALAFLLGNGVFLQPSLVFIVTKARAPR